MPDQTPAKQLTKSRYGLSVSCCSFAARVADQASMSSQSCRFAAATASASRLRSTRPWLLYVVVFQMQRPPCRSGRAGEVCDACGNPCKPSRAPALPAVCHRVQQLHAKRTAGAPRWFMTGRSCQPTCAATAALPASKMLSYAALGQSGCPYARRHSPELSTSV